MSGTTTPPPAASVLAALDHPDLFGPHFAGSSWTAWRAFLAALYAEPMTAEELTIFRQCTGRSDPPAAPFREAALVVGRRGGKSRVLALLAVAAAVLRDYSPFLAAGEVATVAVLASDRKQARTIFRYASGLLKAIPALAPLVVREDEESITLNNRVVVEISTASFRTARGYSFAAILCDEIAFWRSEETSANPDTEILRALRPGMSSIPGSILLLASSPYAKKGELYSTYRRNFGRDDARVLVWQADTATMNPKIDPSIIAEAYESDPESAKAEFGAQFRDDLADFITRETIDAVTAFGRHDLPPEPGITYSAFCDPSGGASDAMTLAIGHLRDGAVAVLDAVLEVRAPFDPDAAVADCAALLRRFGITRVQGDRYAGQWPVARFAQHGIAFEQCARPKSDLYGDFLPLTNSRRVELLDVPRLAAQLVGLERRTARSGRDSIDHAPGGHDDLANAVAGVLVGLDLDRRAPMISSGSLLSAGQPEALPSICNAAFGVLVTDARGSAAVIFAAMALAGPPLVLLDFDDSPFHGGTLAGAAARLAELARGCGARRGAVGIWCPAALAAAGGAGGVPLHAIPPETADLSALMLRAAGHIAEGRVKLSTVAAERALASPLGGALDFRAGDDASNPLRMAALLAVALALEGR